MKNLFISILITSILQVTLSAAQLNDLRYREWGSTITITGCDLEATGDLVIPETIEGMRVTIIDDDAFRHCSRLTSVTIPASVVHVNANAFHYCDSLTSINVHSYNAYYSSSNGLLLRKPTGNDPQTTLLRCPGGRTGSLIVPPNVTVIAASAFEGCKQLTGVTLQAGVTKIYDFAFFNCSSLESITIPASVTSIGNRIFRHCVSLLDINLDPENLFYSSVEGVLYNKLQTTLIVCPKGKVGETAIPSSVTSVSDYAFYNCGKLTSLTIPDSATHIGDYAFYGCTGLTSVSLGNSITSVGDFSFGDCTGLTSITMPDSVASIGRGAFVRCSGLSNVIIPIGTITLGDDVFNSCSSLTSVMISQSIVSIGESAFANCSELTSIDVDPGNLSYSSIEGVLFNKLQTTLIKHPERRVGVFSMPISVTSIVDYAFANCSELTSIDVDPGNLSYSSIEGVLFNKLQTTLIKHPEGRVGVFSIPISVTSIVDNAFANCRELTGIDVDPDNFSYSSVEGVLFNKLQTRLIKCPGGKVGTFGIPISVTSINDSAFYNCTGLTSVLIPDSVTSIGFGAFAGCTGLTSVTIPANVSFLGASSFSRCSRLESAIFEGNSINNFGVIGISGVPPLVFKNVAANFKVYYYEDATGFTEPDWQGHPNLKLQLDDDNDGDNFPNELERLLGTDPLDENSRLRVWISNGGAGMQIHYSPHSDACEFIVESTIDLSDPHSWQVDNSLIFSTDSNEPSANLPTDVTVSVFYRIQVNVVK